MSSLTSFHSFLDKCDWKVGGAIKSFLDTSVNEEIDGETPLTRVLKNKKCSLDIVKLLLDYGADVNCRNLQGSPPLLVAISCARDQAIIEALLRKGAQPKAENRGRTYICFALCHGASRSVIKLLLDAGCPPDACKIHYVPLRCATVYPNLGLQEGVIELLFEVRARMYHKGDESLICLALNAGASLHDIKVLMREGCSLDECVRHASPWFCATHSPWRMELKPELVQLLLNLDVSMDIVNNDGWTPLQYVLCHCKYQTEAIKMWLKKTDVSGKNNDTLLHLAVGNDHCKLKIAKLLIELGLKADLVGYCGETPLHRAVMSSCINLPSVINLLLQKGCPVNAKNVGGFTPLKKAVQLERDCSVIQMLLAAGARIDDSSLRFVFKQYDDNQCEYSLDILKMLVKYSFLENINFEINWIEGEKDCDALVSFAVQCGQEVRQLSLEEIGSGYTLHDLVTEKFSSPMFAAVVSPGARNYYFNRLLRIMDNAAFPLFFDAVSAKLGKMTLKTHLQEREVYTLKYSHFSCVEKSILEYDCLCWIMAYLSHADLLSLLVAYAI